MRIAPAYPVPYAAASSAQITEVLERVRRFLEVANPVVLEGGAFRVISYEWGVTYAGMLHAAAATGDARFQDFVTRRVHFIAEQAAANREKILAQPQPRTHLHRVVAPVSLDDSGALCAALIRTFRLTADASLRPWIDNYVAYISTGQKRLADGTLARDQPFPDTLWLDDLYMSVPALAQAGALTGERRYYDDAAKQLLQFSARMFVPGKDLYRHAWVQGMRGHPVFCWARANGWALMAAVELLEVLPENHPQRAAVLAQYQAHARGLAACQGGDGLWHQLLDRSDSYAETSASAMFVFGITRGINRGWLDALEYAPMASLGWNAVAQKVNSLGQVEGTCIGTGIGWEPTYYYYRPTSPFAAHGYGPVLLAGAEMIALRQGRAP